MTFGANVVRELHSILAFLHLVFPKDIGGQIS